MSRRDEFQGQPLLRVPAWAYGKAMRLRNRLFDRPQAVQQATLPVISIGNLSVGGTGKTPMVHWLACRLGEDGHRPAVISRGYGGSAGRGPLLVSRGSGPLCTAERCGDEPLLLAKSLPGVAVVVGSDRLAGVQCAAELDCDVALLDDGFQHRRIARDLDLVLLDATQPLEDARMLPAGSLREPLEGLGRAGALLITRSRSIDTSALEQTLRRYNPHAPIFHADHRTSGFVNAEGREVPRPSRALVFCGIGNPDRFRSDLEAEGLEILRFERYRDHRRYSTAELSELAEWAARHEAAAITTEKDLARIGSAALARRAGAPFLALRIRTVVREELELMRLVRTALEQARS